MLSLPEDQRVLYNKLWDWMVFGGLDADLAFVMDQLTLVMCFVVTFVGTLIHVYSVGYMDDEPSYWRFFCYLNLFMFAMLTLVLGDNLLVMFIGWEGVGLCSYLLISFWYKEHANAVAGMKAFVVNRIGDFGFIIAAFLLFWGIQGTWSDSGKYSFDESEQAAEEVVEGEVVVEESQEPVKTTSVTFREIEKRLEQPGIREGFLNKEVFGISLVTLIAILFFVGAMGKSAQIPLYVWLPDAMAGPTPVSALIHAATMVTAGVYMVARLNFIFALSPFAMTWVAGFGCLTAIFAATIGFFQYDIKKVLAYSTVSQLGYMFIAVGVGAYWVGIFHLFTHAFFKACLFLGSGSVILGCHHEQDMRKMGGLKKLMPVTAWTYFAACCAIAGFPFTSGFFSKDEILWKAFSSGNIIIPGGAFTIWVIGAITAVCTSYYMFRSYYMTFSGEYRGGHDSHAHSTDDHGDSHDGGNHHHAHVPHESPVSMTFVLKVLAIFSLFVGFIGLPHLWHLPNFFHHWLDPVFEGTKDYIHSGHFAHSVEWGLMIFSVILAFTGWFVARWLYKDNKNPIPAALLKSKDPLTTGFHKLVYNKYYVDEIYDAVFIKGAHRIKSACDWFDRNVIDRMVNLAGITGREVGMLSGKADNQVVDGAVNGVANGIQAGGRQIRRVQTGNIRTYLYVVMTGAIVLIVVNYLLFA